MDSLDKKSIDSFLRVAGGLAQLSLHSRSETNRAASAGSNPDEAVKDMSVIERAVKEGENIRLILRSNGHEFPAKDNTTHDNNPAYVVCLSHHVPSDQFILFVFNATTMPCQFMRYDRDGNVVESDVIGNHMCWSEIDAAVLVAAVNKCHEGNAAYFDNAACASNDKRRGECVRLVNMKDDADGTDVMMRSPGSGEEYEDSDVEDLDEDEFEVIRTLILTELLSDGSNAANFHHPDPNFLLPLSESISTQLYTWRYLCNYTPSRSEWPKLPSPPGRGAAANAEGVIVSEGEELDDISLGRNSQFRKSVEYCQNAIEKMKSLLCKIVERGMDSASIYELGKEGILSLTTLEFMNQTHADTWPDYHELFEGIEQTCFEASTQIKENLMTWKSASESIPMEESDDEEEEYDGCVEVASKLVMAWIKEDKALLKALSNVVESIEQTLKSEQQSLQGAIDRVESELDSILSLKIDAERKTKLNTSRLIKLWNSSCPDEDDAEEGSDDEDDEPWLRGALIPQWTKYDLESQISFGWCEVEHEDPSVMKFVIDVAGLTAGLKKIIDRLTTYTTDSSQTHFDIIWKNKIQPTVNSTVKSIKALLELGDLRNASIVAACCLRVFCDGDVIGAVGHWYENNDSYECEYDSHVVVAKKFQDLWSEYHPNVAAIALAYFDIESPQREAGSHWFFDILQSGFVYAPSNSSYFCWSTENRITTAYNVCWGRLSHPACGIFHSHGWQHPVFHCLRGCNKEEELSLSGLRTYEAPTVIKERFNMTKKLGRTRDSIEFARIMGGDHECIQYLFNNGLVDEAMVQASASKNVEGLLQLSKGLLSTNPRASVLCMQAYILEVMEGIDARRYEFPKEGIDNLVDILEEKLPKSAFAGDVSQQRVLTGVPSLRLLTTISLARAFLCAAKSTAEIQAIFEQKYFVQSGISPLLATIAIIARATFARTNASNLGLSLKYFLRKLGLLSVDDETGVSGSLAQFESIGKTLDEMDYLDLVCFLYESAKILMEEGCRSIFCFTLALFSSVQIAVRTGCISFALGVIGSLKEIEKDRFYIEYYSISPLSSLSACFSALFTSVGYNTCQEVQDALLETFLTVKVKGLDYSRTEDYISHKKIFNEDVHQSRVWMGMAYAHRRGKRSAMDAIVSSIISNHLSGADSRTYMDEVILKTFRSLQVVHEARGGNHTMKSYVESGKRQQLTEKDRDEMIKCFISKVLVTSTFLASDTVAELIQHYRAIDPLFLVGDANDIETNLINVSEFKTGLSQKASLFVTSTIMHYVHDNNYIVLELGLRWLRNALCSPDGVVQFDNYDDYGRGRWPVNKFKEDGDYEVFFSSHAWSDSYLYQHETRNLEGQPKLAANALVAVLEAKALLLLEQTPRISHLCREALALCRVLDFLLEPTLEAIAAVDEAWRYTQLQKDQLPPFLQPKNLVALIMDLEWSVRPDYIAKREDGEGTDGVPSISFIDERAAIAVHYGKITDAVSLCAKAWNKEFWAKLSDRASQWSIDWECSKKIRRVLRACLHIIKGAISSGEDLPDDFMNQALHMILSMNWFRACTKCSPDVSKYAQQLVVCHDSIALVHEIAFAWSDLSDKTKSPFGQSLGHCSNVIQCLSRCMHTLREEGLFLDWRCGECKYPSDISTVFDEAEEAVGQAKARKRRKLLGKSSAVSDFKELERYATQLHMKEQCHWCKDATRRIEKKRRVK